MGGHASPQTSRMVEYCPEPSCDDPENPGFPRPVDRLGYCATHRRQLQRTGKVSTIVEKVSAKERLINLGDAWLSEEDDEQEKVLYRRFIAAAKGMPDESDTQGIVERYEAEMRERRAVAARTGLERARQQGKRIGRPRKSIQELDLDELVRGVFAETKSVSATARALGLNRRTVRARLSTKARLSAQSTSHPAGPQRAG
jgi:hypothetical protein